MDTATFNVLFHETFAEPLLARGMHYVGRSSTLQFTDETRDLRLIRQGGRFERPGVWRSVICFRHSFLRPIEDDDPLKAGKSVSDFPRKLVFDDFSGWPRRAPLYKPQNTGRYPIHDFQYGGCSEKDVRNQLSDLQNIMVQRVLPWAQSLTVAGELAQLQKHGERAWCEERWIEDYRLFIKS